MSHSAEKDALVALMSEHAWERAHYGDYAAPSSPIGKWGHRCPCGAFVKGERGHREHVAEAILAARPIPPGWNPTPPEGGYTAEDF